MRLPSTDDGLPGTGQTLPVLSDLSEAQPSWGSCTSEAKTVRRNSKNVFRGELGAHLCLRLAPKKCAPGLGPELNDIFSISLSQVVDSCRQASSGLPDDAFRIIALPPPTSGTSDVVRSPKLS